MPLPSLLLAGLALLAAPPGPRPRPPSAPATAVTVGRGPAKAAPAPRTPVETDECVHQGLGFKVHLVKVAGAQAPDDLALVLEQRGLRQEARLPGHPPARWWKLGPLAAGPGWRPSGACKRVESVPAAAGRRLLLALVDGRPGADHLYGVLYEVRGLRVLDVLDLGPFGALETFAEGAVFFRQGALAEAAGDLVDGPAGALPLPDGDALTSAGAAPRPLNPVQRVWTAGNRIHQRADPERTFRAATATAPELGRVFADAKALAAAFGLGSATPRPGFRAGTTGRGRPCVQPAGPGLDEDWRALRWYCAPATP